jgi:hypothetical protein
MYKVSYYPTEKKDIVFFKWFKTLKESTEFVSSLKVPEAVLEIKFYDPNDPNQPRPPYGMPT